jgi:hypothetical protein
MTIVFRLESRTCPRCGLPLKVVQENGSDALVARYDMSAWTQSCTQTDCDGPMSCPHLRASMRSWLEQLPNARYETVGGSPR